MKKETFQEWYEENEWDVYEISQNAMGTIVWEYLQYKIYLLEKKIEILRKD